MLDNIPPFSEVNFAKDWLQRPDMPVTVGEVKEFATVLSKSTARELNYGQALQATAGGWGYSSYESMMEASKSGTIVKINPVFDISGVVATAARMTPKKERAGRSSGVGRSGVIINHNYLKNVLAEVEKVAQMHEAFNDYQLEGFIPAIQTEKGQTNDLTLVDGYTAVGTNDWEALVKRMGIRSSLHRTPNLPVNGVFAVDFRSGHHSILLAVVQMQMGMVVHLTTITTAKNKKQIYKEIECIAEDFSGIR